ncbi:MAG TPA: YciI family protein [Mycobacteriales bacterium]|nr:YciI family protein [Mycobacteriales bacterium]
METYFFRIVPPRAMSLPHMRADELKVIDLHVAYWLKLMQRGHVLAFGPVADDTGNYGVGVIQAQSPEQARAIADNDPAVTDPLLSFRTTVTPMHTVMSPVLMPS